MLASRAGATIVATMGSSNNGGRHVSITTTLTLLGGAAALFAYVATQLSVARRSAEIRVRVEDRRRPGPRR